VATYRDACPPGSLMAISHITDEHAPPELREEIARIVGMYRDDANEHVYPRNHAQLATWFAGTELVEPGLTRLCDWRPVDTVEADEPAAPLGYGGVGRIC